MKFSVALCTYNGEKYIEEQLNSILRQSVRVSEIIICDDNSKDNTVTVADSILKNSGISYQIMINDPPLGVADNFLKALKHTRGDYVFTCDQDDIWHDDKVKFFWEAVQQSRKALYFSDGILVDGDAKPLGSTLWEAYGVDRELESGEALLPILIRRPMVTGAAMLVSRELIDQINEIPEQWLHDEWFAMIAAVKDNISTICVQTFDYRQHGNNVVGAKKYSFFEKARLWVSNIEKLSILRRIQLEKSRDVLLLTAGTQYESINKEAVAFWEAMVELSKVNMFKGVFRVLKIYSTGDYKRFYTGPRGALRDILACIIRK